MVWETAQSLTTRINAYQANHEDYIRWVMAQVGPIHDKAALELGCGVGTFLAQLYQAGAKTLVGMDIREDMLLKARKTCPTALLLHQSFDEPWAIQHKVDVVMAAYSAYYSRDVKKLVQSAYQALALGGRLVVIGPSPVSSWEVLEHRRLGLPMTELRGNEKASEIVSAVATSFGSASVDCSTNRLVFQDLNSFTDYYSSTALIRQLGPGESESAVSVMKQSVEEVLDKYGHLVIDKEVWGVVGLKE